MGEELSELVGAGLFFASIVAIPFWVRLGRRRMTPGRPVTFVVTEAFLDHFGLESARDLPGLKELRAAGLLDNRPPPREGEAQETDEDGEDGDLFGPPGSAD